MSQPEVERVIMEEASGGDDGNGGGNCSAHGVPSGEIFVRVNSATICCDGGVLHGVRPFLLQELLLPQATIEQQLESRVSKLALVRQLRRQTKVWLVVMPCWRTR